MEYFFDKIHFHLFKNYILKDPLCDWFNIQNYMSHGKYEEDESTYYQKYIVKESKTYKTRLLNKIKELSCLDIPLETGINETNEKIKNDFPLLIQCNLLDKQNVYVKCDLVIKYNLFKKIFPNIDNIPFHLLLKKDDYLLINFTYSTLHFKIDLKDVVNEPLIIYKKCGLYAFRNALHEISKKQYKCFLLGKEYTYKNTLLPKKEFICKPELDENIHNTYVNAIKWIVYLKNNFNEMRINPSPNHNSLFPNMNYKESNWENEKLVLANKIKEITLVWNISYDERCSFLEKDIKCWDDPRLLSELKESKKKDIQERMIHMNQQKEIIIYPRKNISLEFQKILNKTEYDIYFDVESFLSFNEKQDLFIDLIHKKEPVLGILGFISREHFFNYTIYDFSLEEERKIVKSFSDHLWKIGKGLNKINIYHWGHAEHNYFKYIQRTYPDIKFPDYDLINVLDYFRMEPIIVQGVFKFGLKSIGKALYDHKMIQTTWNENDNGLDSMIQFKDICLNHQKKIPLKRYVAIDQIIEYNRVDCQVLYEIVELLRNKYS